MRKLKLIGCEKISGQSRFVAAIYNRVRIGSLTGWWTGRTHKYSTPWIRLKRVYKEKKQDFQEIYTEIAQKISISDKDRSEESNRMPAIF